MVLEEYESAIQGLIEEAAGPEVSMEMVQKYIGNLRDAYQQNREGYWSTANQKYNDLRRKMGLETNRRVSQLVIWWMHSALADEILVR